MLGNWLRDTQPVLRDIRSHGRLGSESRALTVLLKLIDQLSCPAHLPISCLIELNAEL